MSEQLVQAERGVLGWIDRDITGPMADFQDPNQEWRRLFSEFYGTFLLVLVAAGGGMMSQAFPNTISRSAAVVAPGLMVMGIILFMGKVSGAHLNPAVSVAFALRGDFPWRRVPGYIVVQLAGATLAALFLQLGDRRVGEVRLELSRPGLRGLAGATDGGGPHAWASERDPGDGLGRAEHRHLRSARRRQLHRPRWSVGQPDLRDIDESRPHVRTRPRRVDFTDYWVYVVGPLLGAVIAVGIAYVLRGPGGGESGSGAAQGDLFTEEKRPEQDSATKPPTNDPSVKGQG